MSNFNICKVLKSPLIATSVVQYSDFTKVVYLETVKNLYYLLQTAERKVFIVNVFESTILRLIR